ncbi:MAG: DUF4381 domain-containing protein [Proteobacteria bacterium]|jgi:hypothetical protein|nr:DUF4381 domain-containing protein [Pseudomonadales bacterium]MDA0805562.1 DUF4381 domain-containing protein [Pseudomonadota bacterium]MDA0895839.1 DUF4381 domain-containing protein [Pseudomonadota bacterium]MDA1244030.1 DUF4381 domain-containing protein [Pseudomonadota bacterium]
MDSEELLAQLADIRLPSPISWWPPAPGWWLLAVITLIAIVFAWRAYARARDAKLLLSFALAELERCMTTYNEHVSRGDQLAGLNLLNGSNSVLRRVALFHNQHTEIASLSGEEWVQFLRASSASAEPLLDDQLATGFARGRFQRQLAVDPEKLHAFATAWIIAQYRQAGTNEQRIDTTQNAPRSAEANA